MSPMTRTKSDALDGPDDPDSLYNLEMANKPVPVGITRTRPRFDRESPL